MISSWAASITRRAFRLTCYSRTWKASFLMKSEILCRIVVMNRKSNGWGRTQRKYSVEMGWGKEWEWTKLWKFVLDSALLWVKIRFKNDPGLDITGFSSIILALSDILPLIIETESLARRFSSLYQDYSPDYSSELHLFEKNDRHKFDISMWSLKDTIHSVTCFLVCALYELRY